MLRNIRTSVWLLPAAAIILSLLPALLYVFFDIAIIAGYLLALVCSVALLKPVHASKTKLLASCLLTAFIFLVSFHFRFDEVPIVMKYEVLLDPKFVTCKEHAVPVSGKGVIGVCERHEHEWGASVDTIIYDSTDEIILAPSQRSEEWKSAVKSKSINAPFGYFGFTVERITDHYYDVYFLNGLPMNF